jgi:tetratricopeptide (TPR) repeat protein
MKILILTLISTILLSKAVFAQNDATGSLQEAIELFKNGELVKAEDILVKRINADRNDTDSRLMLGMFANLFGKKNEAVSIWEAGLNGDNVDYPLLMSIGEVYLDELTNMQTGISALEGDAATQEEYLRKHDELCQKAIRIFAKANGFHAYEAEPIEKLAMLYGFRKNYDSALYFWDKLAEMYPHEAKYLTSKGNVMMLKNDYNSAMKFFRAAVSSEKNFAQAYLGLSECFRAVNRDLEADLYAKKAEFYMLCPSFLEISYTSKFSDILDSLFLTDAPQKSDFDAELFLEKQGNDAPEIAAFLLNCRIFSGTSSEKKLTDYLGKSGKKGVWYLMKLTETSEDPVFIDNAVSTLISVKPEGLFDFLDGLLKQNIITFGHAAIHAFRQMDDYRIVATLIREIMLRKRTPKQLKRGSLPMHMALLTESLHGIRAEAVLALSDFRTSASIEFLKQGIEDEQIAPYCGAALYKITGDEKYLQRVGKLLKESENDIILADFLNEINCPKAQKLAKKLAQF